MPSYSEIQHLYINAAAAKRILGLPASRKIEFLDVRNDRLTVQWKDREGLHQVVLVNAQFEAEFQRVRREGAKECLARPLDRSKFGERYEVTGTQGDLYFVETSDRAIACTCQDWFQHETICKHGYAVLSLLGLATFEQLQVARRKVVYADIPRRESKRQTATIGKRVVGIE